MFRVWSQRTFTWYSVWKDFRGLKLSYGSNASYHFQVYQNFLHERLIISVILWTITFIWSIMLYRCVLQFSNSDNDVQKNYYPERNCLNQHLHLNAYVILFLPIFLLLSYQWHNFFLPMFQLYFTIVLFTKFSAILVLIFFIFFYRCFTNISITIDLPMF